MHPILVDTFTLSEPILEVIVRPILVYLFLVIALRLSGKRELAQVNSFDLVVLLTISNLLQNAGIGSDTSVLAGWVSTVALLTTNYLVIRLIFRHPRVGRIIEGTPRKLVEDGKVLFENLEKEMISYDELVQAIHRQGVEEVKDVRRCELDSDGTIAVFEKHPTELEMIESEERAIHQKLDELLLRLDGIEQHLAPSAG